jgi:predicted HD phosphohydrolase
VTDLDEVLDLYDRFGGEMYDEDVAQLHHALQVAALAASTGASDALVTAALLHDVGHLLTLRDEGHQVGAHEQAGPAFLAGLFPSPVIRPIALHVAAKRYLCAVDPDYSARLSSGSVQSLGYQGGPMSADEVLAFRTTPGWTDAIALRRWDDAGKEERADVPGLASYWPLLRAVACSGF